jgi:hypothetical protein
VETTEPMSIDQAVEAMVAPEQPVEEVVEEESQSASEPEAELEEEQPEEDSFDEDEAEDDDDDEPESDDADDEGDEDYEDDVDEAEDEQDPETELITVKVDGVEEQVTLEDLKRGYSGQKYVQQGMQKAAEARKEAEDVYVALMQERQNLANVINQVQQGALTPPQEPSRDLFDSDPIGYMEAKMNYDEQMKEYNQNMQVVQQQMQQQSQAEEQARSRYITEEAYRLVEAMPELSDQAKLEAFQKRIRTAGEKFGYTKEELAGITSHRDMLILDAAAKYMALQDGKEIVRQKAKKARKPVKAGAKKTVKKGEAARKQRDKLRQSGSIEDAMSLILDPNLK